ncbi:Unknown protein, partial [Striga hermonthica]
HSPDVSHLMFADDTLVMCEANGGHARTLMTLLHRYQLFTGQSDNMGKSSIFFSRNCSSLLKTDICYLLGGIKSHRSTRYLGLPLGIGKSKKESFDYILKAVRD